jgi:mannose-6-phosphate isomerase-like protein (cupin superfamily)
VVENNFRSPLVLPDLFLNSNYARHETNQKTRSIKIMSQVISAPKILSAGEGESYQMLSHTFTTKVSVNDTHGKWLMYEASDTANNGAPLHTHPWEETFYILEGELEVQVGTQIVLAKPGASIYFPANIAHGFKICSPTTKLLVIIPGFAEGFYREIGEKITSLPPNLEVFQQVCDRHGVRLIM